MLRAVSAAGVAGPAPVGVRAGCSLQLPAGWARDSELLTAGWTRGRAAGWVRGRAVEHGRAAELSAVGQSVDGWSRLSYGRLACAWFCRFVTLQRVGACSAYELISGLVDSGVGMQWFGVDGWRVDSTLEGHISGVDAVICRWTGSHAVYTFPANVNDESNW